eukprot:g19304.t1
MSKRVHLLQKGSETMCTRASMALAYFVHRIVDDKRTLIEWNSHTTNGVVDSQSYKLGTPTAPTAKGHARNGWACKRCKNICVNVQNLQKRDSSSTKRLCTKFLRLQLGALLLEKNQDVLPKSDIPLIPWSEIAMCSLAVAAASGDCGSSANNGLRCQSCYVCVERKPTPPLEMNINAAHTTLFLLPLLLLASLPIVLAAEETRLGPGLQVGVAYPALEVLQLNLYCKDLPRYLEVDHEVWTRYLQKQPGFVSKINLLPAQQEQNAQRLRKLTVLKTLGQKSNELRRTIA